MEDAADIQGQGSIQEPQVESVQVDAHDDAAQPAEEPVAIAYQPVESPLADGEQPVEGGQADQCEPAESSPDDMGEAADASEKPARAKRLPAQILRDREKIAELYCMGKSAGYIASIIGVSRPTIFAEFKKIRQQ